MSDNFDKVESDIRRHEFSKMRRSYSRRELAGYCETCGRPIYSCDREGIPYRQCYKCNFGGQI